MCVWRSSIFSVSKLKSPVELPQPCPSDGKGTAEHSIFFPGVHPACISPERFIFYGLPCEEVRSEENLSQDGSYFFPT